MARKAMAKEVVVKLIVGAGQASPSPPVGPALGSKGVKSMDFCKEFNARTANYVVGTPIPARVTVRPDRSFYFELRSPPTASLLFAAAGVPQRKNKVRGAGNVPGPRRNAEAASAFASIGPSSTVVAAGGDAKAGAKGPAGKASGSSAAAGNGGIGIVGTVSLKHVYEIAKIKQAETRLEGLSLEGLCRSVVAQAGSCGIAVVP